jgi:uncharacterized protein
VGAPAFKDVLKGVRLLREEGYPFRTITVVTEKNVRFAHEILDFFCEMGLEDLRFNPVLRNGRGREHWNQIGIAPLDYFAFMKEVLNTSLTKPFFHEDNIEALLRNMVARTRDFKCMRTNCGCGHQDLCVDTNGDLYPCAYFLSETGDLRMGNIHTIPSLMDCGENHPLISTFPNRLVSKIEGCRSCDWRHLCEGGCTLGAYLQERSLLSPTYLCEYFQGMYPYLFAKCAEDPQSIANVLRNEVVVENI